MRKNIWVENGSVFCDATSSCIEHPALLLDYESDLLMKYGEAEYVQGFLSRVAAANSEYAASLSVLELNTLLFTPEECAYVIKRALEYSASGFVRTIQERMLDGSLKSWISSAMMRVPLEIA